MPSFDRGLRHSGHRSDDDRRSGRRRQPRRAARGRGQRRTPVRSGRRRRAGAESGAAAHGSRRAPPARRRRPGARGAIHVGRHGREAYATPGRARSPTARRRTVADRQLRIGVDGRELTGQPTGVGRYVESVLREWARDASFHHQVTIFAAQGRSAAGRARRSALRLACARGANGGHVVGADDARARRQRRGPRRVLRGRLHRAGVARVPAGRRDLRRVVLCAPGVVQRARRLAPALAHAIGRQARGARRHDLRVLRERDRAMARHSARAAW